MILKKLKLFVFAVVCCFVSSSAFAAGNVIYSLDFTKQRGDMEDWFDDRDWDLKSDADDMVEDRNFSSSYGMVTKADDSLGVFTKSVKVANVSKVRIDWGVQKYKGGDAQWKSNGKGLNREPIALIMSFGTKKIDSNHSLLPDAPYFINIFIGNCDKLNGVYIGNTYKKGGRYICVEKISNGQTKSVVTEFEIKDKVKELFNGDAPNTITNLAFEVDMSDTDGEAQAYVRKVEFLD